MMGSAASTVEEVEEWQCLLKKMSENLKVRREAQKDLNPPTKTFTGKVVKICYAGFAVRLDDGYAKNKVMYVARFPPLDGTVVPLFDEESSATELQPDDHISKEEFEEFWSSKDARQSTGLWKGGSWGLDNFTYKSSWCSELYVGDTVTFDFIKNGVIKFQGNTLFTEDQEIVCKTNNYVWCLNITVDHTKKQFPGYGMNFMMPQIANDLLFIWHDVTDGKRYIKILKRGNKDTVDMQNKYMPGAGEHLEAGERFKIKSSLARAFKEELGVDSDSVAGSYLLSLGKFDDPARDPRYWNFYYKDKKFGLKRYSCSCGYVMFYSGTAPKLKEALDTVEIQEMAPNEKRWVELDTLDVTGDTWMIEDHAKLVRKAKIGLDQFGSLSEEDRQKFVFDIQNPEGGKPFVCQFAKSEKK